MLYLKDDNGVKSQTTTLVWVGIGTASIKLFLAGMEIKGIKFGEFTGSEYALVVAPFLALLAHKRQVNGPSKTKSSDASEANSRSE